MILCLLPAGSLVANTVLGPHRFPVPIPKRPQSDEAPRGAILTGGAGRELVTYTCLDKPTADRGYWTPAGTDIERLESGLGAFMSHERTPSDYQPLHEYYRQYAGFTVGDKTYICVNLFHASHVEETLSLAQRDLDLFKKLSAEGPPEDYWRREPVIVNDGGAYFFSVQYEAATSTFRYLRFNGHA